MAHHKTFGQSFTTGNEQTNTHKCTQMCNHSLLMWRVYAEIMHAMAIYGWQIHFWEISETEKERERGIQVILTKCICTYTDEHVCGDMIEIVFFLFVIFLGWSDNYQLDTHLHLTVCDFRYLKGQLKTILQVISNLRCKMKLILKLIFNKTKANNMF